MTIRQLARFGKSHSAWEFVGPEYLYRKIGASCVPLAMHHDPFLKVAVQTDASNPLGFEAERFAGGEIQRDGVAGKRQRLHRAPHAVYQ